MGKKSRKLYYGALAAESKRTEAVLPPPPLFVEDAEQARSQKTISVSESETIQRQREAEDVAARDALAKQTDTLQAQANEAQARLQAQAQSLEDQRRQLAQEQADARARAGELAAAGKSRGGGYPASEFGTPDVPGADPLTDSPPSEGGTPWLLYAAIGIAAYFLLWK